MQSFGVSDVRLRYRSRHPDREENRLLFAGIACLTMAKHRKSEMEIVDGQARSCAMDRREDWMGVEKEEQCFMSNGISDSVLECESTLDSHQSSTDSRLIAMSLQNNVISRTVNLTQANFKASHQFISYQSHPQSCIMVYSR